MQIIKLSINDSYMKFTRFKIEHNCVYPHYVTKVAVQKVLSARPN